MHSCSVLAGVQCPDVTTAWQWPGLTTEITGGGWGHFTLGHHWHVVNADLGDTWGSWPPGQVKVVSGVHLGSHPGPRLSLTTRSHVGARSWSANIVVCVLIPDSLSHKIHSWKYIGHEIYPSSIKYKLLWGHLFPVNKYVLQKSIYIGPFVSNSNLGCNIQEAWYPGGGTYNAMKYDNINSIKI